MHVGGPAYVHTCVLSGSRDTAGVLAFSLNTIFKPLRSSLENHHSVVSQPAQWLLRHSSYLPTAVCQAPCSLCICILASVALVPVFLHFHLVKCVYCRFFYTSDLISARYGHFWCLTGALRKIMALPVGIWGSGFVVIFWLISVSHHVRLSSVSEEMMPNESRQIKSELCVVIKAVAPAGSLPLEYYEHCKGKKKKLGATAVCAAPWSSYTASLITLHF